MHYCSGLQDCAEQINRQRSGDELPGEQFEAGQDGEQQTRGRGDAIADGSSVESLSADWLNISDNEC